MSNNTTPQSSENQPRSVELIVKDLADAKLRHVDAITRISGYEDCIRIAKGSKQQVLQEIFNLRKELDLTMGIDPNQLY